jgi:hypothetical protein
VAVSGEGFFLRRGNSQRIELGFRSEGYDHFGIFFKDCREIEFPYTINMNRFLDGDKGSNEYRLISIASHVGVNSKGGHYIAFCVVEGQWWKFDDATVKAVPLHAVFEDNFPVSKFHHPGIQTASLLLYEIIDTQVPETDSEE